MLLVLEESWTRVQDALRERVGSAAYDAWLRELRPVMLERGTVYLEADSRLVADRVRALFRAQLGEVLSADFGIELKVEVQAREAQRFDALEVSPQRPVIDDGNRTAYLVLQSLLPGVRQRQAEGAVGAGGRHQQQAHRAFGAALAHGRVLLVSVEPARDAVDHQALLQGSSPSRPIARTRPAGSGPRS